MESAVVRLTFEQSEEGSYYYRGTSKRNPIYTFEVSVQPRGSNKHGISVFGTSRISFVALYLGPDKVVSLPRYDQVGRAYELSPLEKQILSDIDARFPAVQLRVVA